jgi:hypothetical protein
MPAYLEEQRLPGVFTRVMDESDCPVINGFLRHTFEEDLTGTH